MGKIHCKEISFDPCSKRELEWFATQDRPVLHHSITIGFQIVRDITERTIPKADLDLIREMTSIPKPTLDGVISEERYSPFEHDIIDRIDALLKFTRGVEVRNYALLQMVGCDCILESSKITADGFTYKGKIYTYKNYKPVQEVAKRMTELGYYILKVVQALSSNNE